MGKDNGKYEILHRFPFVNKDSKLKFKSMPQNITNKFVVCLDAGGGYSDCGAGTNGYYAYVPNA